MITATNLSDQKDALAGVARFSVPTVPAGEESDEIAFAAPSSGTIKGVSIACSSAEFDLSLRQQAAISPPHIDEIYKVTDIENVWRANLHIPYRNRDTSPQPLLYGKIVNRDTNDTGLIIIELTIA